MKVSPLPQWNHYQTTQLHTSQRIMAKTGTADKDLLLLEEEMEALYAQRPASLRVTDSGKKERDPQYHCVMEKVRRRGQKMAIDRLKKALSEYPSGLSLQTTLKAAVEEVTALKAKDNLQKRQIAEMKEKQQILQRKMKTLRADFGGSADVFSPPSKLKELEQIEEPTSVIMSPVPSEPSQPWAERAVFNSSPVSLLSTSSHTSLPSSPNSASLTSTSSLSPLPPTTAFLPNPFTMLQPPAMRLQQSPPPQYPPTVPMVMYPFLSSNFVLPLKSLFFPNNHVQPPTLCPLLPSNTLINYVHRK